MKQIKVNPNNEQFYSEEFIRGFNLGAERQYEADIADMPTWIPCSKRLPKYRKMVDVTTRDLRVELAYLDSIKEDGTDDLWIIPLEDAECALWNIVAWKPRPEPWEGEVD